jgi:hypothetical protein
MQFLRFVSAICSVVQQTGITYRSVAVSSQIALSVRELISSLVYDRQQNPIIFLKTQTCNKFSLYFNSVNWHVHI